MTKKTTKRSAAKYPALRPELNPRTRYELLDYDYLDKLNQDEMQWLQDFTEEYVHANFNHPGRRIHKGRKHAQYKKDCYDRNNARNRCIWSRAKAAGLTVDADILNVVEDFEEWSEDFTSD
jgi:hypothetical protein